MDHIFSVKRRKLPLLSELHPDTFAPQLVTPSARAKYRHMRHSLSPGVITSFNSFSEIFDKLKNIGWECLVVFPDKHIYPALIAEFYCHMSFTRNPEGMLTSISTVLEGQTYVINEQLIINALHLGDSMTELLKVNDYFHPIGTATHHCITFKHNLATVTDQLVPAQLFDFPTKIILDYLTSKCQFLGKILRQNVMPIRDDKTIEPFDLELMKCILNQSMPYSLSYLIFTSFELCYHNNCLGYGLILSSIFKYLGINVLNHHSQLVQSSNIISHLTIPPRPLIIFKPDESEQSESTINLQSQIETLQSMLKLSLQNQNIMLGQIESLQLTVHHMRDLFFNFMEQQKFSVPPYHFSGSTSSAKPEVSPDMNLPTLGLNFSSPPHEF